MTKFAKMQVLRTFQHFAFVAFGLFRFVLVEFGQQLGNLDNKFQLTIFSICRLYHNIVKNIMHKKSARRERLGIDRPGGWSLVLKCL